MPSYFKDPYKKGTIVKVTKSPNAWSDIPKGLVTEVLTTRRQVGWVDIKSPSGDRYGWPTSQLEIVRSKPLRFQYQMSGTFVDDE